MEGEKAMTKGTGKQSEENGLLIDRQRCVGCGSCASACPFGGISVQNGTAETNAACTLCGTCVELCPAEALLPVYLRLPQAERELKLRQQKGE